MRTSCCSRAWASSPLSRMPSDALASWKARLYEGLRFLDHRNQRRNLAEIRGVNFCSNDYLGLAESAALQKAVAEAVQRAERVGGTGSRLLSGQTEEWREVEEEFAKFAGTEAALFFTSGYGANVGLLSSLVGKDDVIFSDEQNHASLIDGMRLSGARKVIYPHLNLNALEDALRQEAGAPWRKVIVTESVFSMDGDIAPLAEIANLAEKYNAALILDEAHATAVQGPSGRGLAISAGLTHRVLALIHTCGKALASAGAFVCGSAVLKDHLVNHARTFIFSTALPPYMAAQIGAALQLAEGMDRERDLLLGMRPHYGNRCGRKDLIRQGLGVRSCPWCCIRMRRRWRPPSICSARDSRCGPSGRPQCRRAHRGCDCRLRCASQKKSFRAWFEP